MMFVRSLLGPREVHSRILREAIAASRATEQVFLPFVAVPIRGIGADLHSADGIGFRSPLLEGQPSCVTVFVHEFLEPPR
jgi:hypothetical protein